MKMLSDRAHCSTTDSRFRALATKISLDQQGRLVHRETGKIILPYEHFANAVILKVREKSSPEKSKRNDRGSRSIWLVLEECICRWTPPSNPFSNHTRAERTTSGSTGTLSLRLLTRVRRARAATTRDNPCRMSSSHNPTRTSPRHLK